jgi:hypothetical protein
MMQQRFVFEFEGRERGDLEMADTFIGPFASLLPFDFLRVFVVAALLHAF